MVQWMGVSNTPILGKTMFESHETIQTLYFFWVESHGILYLVYKKMAQLWAAWSFKV